MTDRPLFIRPEAKQDLDEARAWYDQQQEGLGSEFLAKVYERFEEIEQSPQHYAAGYRGVRAANVDRFPYVVRFAEINSRIEVIAVHHGSRNSREWRRRARN
ncbi:MAG: recombinase [Pirellula sp.]|nr:recombinase [Pirellula sp.]